MYIFQKYNDKYNTIYEFFPVYTKINSLPIGYKNSSQLINSTNFLNRTSNLNEEFVSFLLYK